MSNSSGKATTRVTVTDPPPLQPTSRTKHAVRPIPTMGVSAFLYKIAKLCRSSWIPPLGANEKRHLAELADQQLLIATEKQRQTVRTETITRLSKLSDETPSATFACLNAKGAAATTTTTVYTASVMGDVTRSVLLLLDANPASGTSAARVGKDYGETLTVSGLSDNLGLFSNFKEFIREIRPTRYSVRVVSADSIVEDGRHFSDLDFTAILDGLTRHSEYLLVDTANNIIDPVSLQVVEAADVLVFTANVAVHDSLRQLATTMETLRKHGHSKKVNNAVVVISNLPDGSALDNFRKYLHHVNLRDEVVKEYEPFAGQFIGVPHDPEISKDSEVDIPALGWDTHQSYLEVCIALLEQADVLADKSSTGYERSTS